MGDCERSHQKVYANVLLTSDPPMRPWICQRCGAEGADREAQQPRDLYEETKRRFETLRAEETDGGSDG